MKYCLLASGSRGNAIWVEEDGLAILVDNGLSARELTKRAGDAGLNMANLQAVFITHEHSDHVRGVDVLVRKHKLKVLANQGTVDGAGALLNRLDLDIFKTGDQIDLGPLKIKSLPIPHDTADPVAFTIESGNGARLGIATDLGQTTRLIEEKLKGVNALILEFNHDFKMLMDGPYPWFLKQRIRGRYGHLANEDACTLVNTLRHAELRQVVLAHLSETNNSPQLAHETARRMIDGDGLQLAVAGPNHPTPVFEL